MVQIKKMDFWYCIPSMSLQDLAAKKVELSDTEWVHGLESMVQVS
jgi:hypothetical protein